MCDASRSEGRAGAGVADHPRGSRWQPLSQAHETQFLLVDVQGAPGDTRHMYHDSKAALREGSLCGRLTRRSEGIPTGTGRGTRQEPLTVVAPFPCS